MCPLAETRGTALVTALMLTMLALVIALALLYMVSAGSRITAGQKRYRSALAAAHGGVELVTGDLLPHLLRLDPQGQLSLQSDFLAVGLKVPGYACLQQKLTAGSAAWSACSADQAGADPALAPDLNLTLGGEEGAESFAVSVKIVDTVPGNTDTSGIEGLDPGSSVAGQQEVIRPQHVPSLFNIAVQGVGGRRAKKPACPCSTPTERLSFSNTFSIFARRRKARQLLQLSASGRAPAPCQNCVSNHNN